MSSAPPRPTPPESALSAPYWEGLAQGELRLQACAHCGTLRHYPRLLCTACFREGVTWRVASGRGRIHSWTVAHHAYHPAFGAELPYTLVTVDLDEGPRALGRWHGGELALGLRVRARVEMKDGVPALVFEPQPG